MIYLILSVFCSVLVGIVIKVSKGFKADIFQMISINYLIAVLMSIFLFEVDLSNTPLNLPKTTVAALVVLLPTIFIVLFKSVQYVGIIRTDIAQRLSLFLPILAAITIFSETISPLKALGILIGISSIYLILSGKKTQKIESQSYVTWIYPILVFIGFGVIDILFKQLALYTEIPYTSSMLYVFIGAGLVSLGINLFYIIFKARKITLASIGFGLPLGLFNFLNIFFYLKAHQVFKDNPTTVFAGMNFGVIILGSLVGYYVFKETLRLRNVLGIFLALLAVSIILVAQYYML